MTTEPKSAAHDAALLDQIDAEIEKVRQNALNWGGGLAQSAERDWQTLYSFKQRVLDPMRAALATPQDQTDPLDARMVGALLPCPFCGARAERIDIDDGENAGGSCVACTHCQASSNVEFERKENFVSNWNRRATPPSQTGALDARTVEDAFNDGYTIGRSDGEDYGVSPSGDAPDRATRRKEWMAKRHALAQHKDAAPVEQDRQQVERGDAPEDTHEFATGSGSWMSCDHREAERMQAAGVRVRLRTAPPAQGDVEPVAFEMTWPDYHYEGMGCGLEDRGIRDRYEAMRYGWDCAIDACAERLPEKLYEEPPTPRPASDDALAVLRGYERWEANLIMDGDWRNEMPKLTQALYDEMMELQARRNAVLAGKPSSDDARDAGRHAERSLVLSKQMLSEALEHAKRFDPFRRVDFGDGLYGPAFLDCVDEDWSKSQIDALASMFGLEVQLLAAVDGLDPLSDGWTIERAIASATQPIPAGEGWELRGVGSNEDDEIVFVFVRATIARQAAGGVA